MPHRRRAPALPIGRGDARRRVKGRSAGSEIMKGFVGGVKEAGPAIEAFESTSSHRQTAWGGLLVRRYRWGLSRPTKFIAVFAFVTLGVIAFLNAYHFLAITERVEGDVLVVEGWVHFYAIT